MKTLLMTMLIAITVVATAQNSTEVLYFLTEKIVEETGGFKDATISQNGYDFNIIAFSSFYNFDLVRMQVNAVIENYSDIIVINNWYRQGDKYQLDLHAFKKYVIVINYIDKKLYLASAIKE